MIDTTKVGYITPVGRLTLIRHQPLVSQLVRVAANESVGRLEAGDYSLLLIPNFDPNEFVVFELKAPHQKITELSADPDAGYYVKNINVRTNLKGINKVHYPNNTMIAACCADPSVGRWTLYQMMLVSQDGEFFLTYERLAATQFLRNSSGNLVCPELDGKWQHLKSALVSWMKDRGYGKDAKSLYAQEEDEYWPTVIDWDSATGNGKISTKYGDVFVTWRECPQRTPGGRRYLRVGERVIVEKIEPIQNPHSTSYHASKVTLP